MNCPPYTVRSFTYRNEQVRADEVQRVIVYIIDSKGNRQCVNRFCIMTLKLNSVHLNYEAAFQEHVNAGHFVLFKLCE
jgi:hypothetical protein